MLNPVDSYIAAFPDEVKAKLHELRAIIQKTAPEAEEVISYAMPAYRANKVLVYFAGYKHHIGFYPTPSGIAAFVDKLADYTWSKGAVQFPLDRPLPTDLIIEMVRFRMRENAESVPHSPKKKRAS